MRRSRLTLALLAAMTVAAVPLIAPAAEAVKPAEAAAAPARVSVLVLPFAPVAETDRDAWIGRAVAESMTADLAVDRSLIVSLNKEFAANTLAGAADAGRVAQAEFVVFGSVQRVGDEVRFAGQVVRVSDRTVVSGLKATGPLQELFTLQDSLVNQLRRRLDRPTPGDRPIAPAPAPIAEPADDGVLGVTAPPDRRDAPAWLEPDDHPQFAADVRDGRDRYVNTYPVAPYYFGGYYPYSAGYGYCYPHYYGDYRPYIPSVRVRITYSDGDGWNGRAHTTGYGVVGGAMRATQKYQPYQGSAGVLPYQQVGRQSGPRVSPVQTDSRMLPIGAAAPRRSLPQPRSTSAPRTTSSGSGARPSASVGQAGR